MDSTQESPPPRGTPEYYRNLKTDSIQDVNNFDTHSGHKAVQTVAQSARSLNFVLNYGPRDAWCVSNVSENALTELINTPAPPEFDSTWIQIWYPHKQKEVIKALANKYDFSPRLAALIQSDPKRHAPPTDSAAEQQHSHRHRFSRRHRTSPEALPDSEKANGIATTPVPNARPNDMLRQLNHYDIVSSIWHWSSIDTDNKHICLGYNSLHNVKPDPTSDNDKRDFLPNGERIWNWLILGYDRTVISITESYLDRIPPGHALDDAADVRNNICNVLEQLSITSEHSSRSAISIIPIRELLSNGSIDASGAAGLLFYYLFDDWYSTYGLLAKSGHRYGAELNSIRRQMREKASLDRVDQLYCLGRQLAVLKLVYQSYMLLIDKLLLRQRDLEGKSSGEQLTQDPAIATNGDLDELSRSVTNTPPRARQVVPLVPGAQDRFERLRDRINLYVVSEIQECIDIKDSLLSMNFNLISIKESDAVERLTRITILLGKVTILFLPVSLMTTYFSVNIAGINYTLAQFWGAFAVILALSFIGLLGFGKISGTTEGNMIYQPINQVFLNIIKGFWNRHRRARGN